MEKLQLAISTFINTYENTIPELKILAVSVPDDQVTNVTVAQEIVCVLKKLQKILPNNLGNFVSRLSFVKCIKSEAVAKPARQFSHAMQIFLGL